MIKNIIIAPTESAFVAYLSTTCAGSMHDKTICDEEGYTYPDQCEITKDKGFQGYEPPNTITYQPKKKSRGEALSLADKLFNRIISSIRIRIEHIITGIKRSHIVKDIFRNSILCTDMIMEIACGLHNYRIKHRSPTFNETPIDQWRKQYIT